MFRSKKLGNSPITINSKKPRTRLILPVVAAILILAGGYFLLLTLAPQSQLVTSSFNEWNQPVEPPRIDENRLYIPKIKINIPYEAGGPEALDEQAWWRFPERGNPVEGGNFILSAHRFELGTTPAQTIRRSPFYHLDRISEGDKIYVDFEGTRYEYTINKRFSVTPTQVEIEAPSEEHKLTIYTCMLAGEEVGRDVLVAELTAHNVDPALPIES